LNTTFHNLRAPVAPFNIHLPGGEDRAGSLELWLLGPWLARFDGQPLPALPTRHTRALLARLALAHPQPLSRSALRRELWPDDPAARTASRLRTTLYLLRRALPDLVHADKETVALEMGIVIHHDVRRFLAGTGPQATRNSLQRAVALYRGPFLEDPGDGWALETSHMLHDRYVQALQRLLAMARAAADPATALQAARRWVQEEPWEEQAHLAVVRALHDLGERSAAQAHINYARTLLQGQWNQSTGEALAVLARAVARLPQPQSCKEPAPYTALLSASSAPPVAPDFDELPLLGRQEELAALTQLWQAARSGQGQIVVVEGPPGVGKTRLVNEFVARVALRRDTLVLQGAGNEQTSVQMPAQPPANPLAWLNDAFLNLSKGDAHKVREALSQLEEQAALATSHYLPALRPLLDPFPGTIPLPALPAPEWGSEAQRRQRVLVALFERLASAGPLCLVLEDGHQVDDASIALARALARRPLPLLILVTRSPFHSCRAAEGIPCLLLDLLPDAEMQTLLEKSLGGRIEPSLMERLLRRSGGNPLFAREILRTLQGQKELHWQPGSGWQLVRPELSLPNPVTDLLARRLQPLQPQTQAFVACLAVLGRPAEEALLARLWPDSGMREAAQAEATLQWVVTERAGRLWFVHDWLGEQVLSNLDDQTRRQWHARIAAALRPHNAAEAMGHAMRTAQWQEALALALEAGEAALAGGHPPALAAAVEIAALAAGHLNLDGHDERSWRRLLLEEGLLAQGEHGDVWQQKLDELQRRAASSRRPAWLATALTRLARARQQQDRPQEAEQALRRAAELAAEAEQPALEAEARATLALTLAEAGHVQRAAAEAQAAQTAGAASGDRALVAMAAVAAALAHFQEGQTAPQWLFSLLQQPALQARPRLALQAYRSAGLTLARTATYEAAIELLQQGVRLAQQVGDAYEAHLCQSLLGSLLICCGLLKEGEALAEACLPAARQMGPSLRLAQLLLHLSRAALAGERPQMAWQLLKESVDVVEQLQQPAHLLPLLAHQARLALALGRQATALAAAARCTQLLPQGTEAGLNIQHLLAHVWLAGGRPHVAREAARQAIRQAATNGPCAWIAVEALWEAAAVLEATGERMEATQAREQAYAFFLDHLSRFSHNARRQAIVSANPCYRTLAAFRSRGPRQLVMLPLEQAPGGRALYPDELLPVIWTVHAPGDAPLVEIAGRRQRLQRLIAEAEAQGASPTVRALADVLAVTPRTLLRDLAALRQEGCSLETRGSRG
jgi:DNA-binding SARP family transcriptional activator